MNFDWAFHSTVPNRLYMQLYASRLWSGICTSLIACTMPECLDCSTHHYELYEERIDHMFCLLGTLQNLMQNSVWTCYPHVVPVALQQLYKGLKCKANTFKYITYEHLYYSTWVDQLDRFQQAGACRSAIQCCTTSQLGCPFVVYGEPHSRLLI